MTLLNHDLTPRMTKHALDRCQEMGIRAKVAKAIYRTPEMVWACRTRPQQRPNTERFHVTSKHFPTFGVVVEVDADNPESVRILTVLEWHGGGRTGYIERQATP